MAFIYAFEMHKFISKDSKDSSPLMIRSQWFYLIGSFCIFDSTRHNWMKNDRLIEAKEYSLVRITRLNKLFVRL